MTPRVQSNDPPTLHHWVGPMQATAADLSQRNRRRVPTKGAPRFGGTGPIGKRWFCLGGQPRAHRNPKTGRQLGA
jgi:hypothetical protein